MVMKTVLADINEVDEGLREHYKESKDTAGKTQYVLDLEGSIDPLPQVRSLKNENAQYRIKAKDFETKYGTLKVFEGMDHAEITAKLDRIAELEAATGGKLDDKAIDAIVEGRIKTKMSPLERQIAALTTENGSLKNQIGDFLQRDKSRAISDVVREAAVKSKMEPSAIEDAIMYAERVMEVSEEGVVTVKDKVGFTPGIDVAQWLTDMQSKRPHWWPASSGAGSRGNGGGGGSDGPNPWSAENWNMTKQGQILTADPKKAERLAQQAGTKIGGPRPAKKTS